LERSSLFFARDSREFVDILRDVQEHMSNKYASLLAYSPEEQKQLLLSYIKKHLDDTGASAHGMTGAALVERLYAEMAEFSFLNQYLYAKDVEEININAWNDIKVTYTDGRIVPTQERFNSPSHAVDVIRRMLHKSGMILDNSQPVIRGHLDNNIRITVFGNPVTDQDKGVAASIRIINPQKLARDDFVNNKTATERMLDFLSLILRYGVSICVTGATGSGKTTLMAWLLSTIPNEKRVVTIENGCREFDLIKHDEEGNVVNNVVHLCTKESDDPRQNVDQEKLLEFTLTLNPDVICVGESKSAEAMAAQEAANTGHAVITTTHANSCAATYYRLVTLCRMKNPMDEKTLYSLVTEAFPIVLFTKKLEDNSRKIMEITECVPQKNGGREIRTLYRYNVNSVENGEDGVKVDGEFTKVHDISLDLQKRLLENGVPQTTLQAFLQDSKVYSLKNTTTEGGCSN
jgi:pilus assembly protein CpaF